MSDKIAFIKANNEFIKSAKLNNIKRTALSETEADEFIKTIVAHPNYKEMEVATASAPTLELDGVQNTEEFGSLLHLPYAGKSKKGFKFVFGDTFCYCNDGTLFLLDDSNKLEVGQSFAFKADTLKQISNSAFFSIRLNYGADATISAVNEKIDTFQGAIETKIKVRAKKYGIDYLTAQAQIHKLMQTEEDASFVSNMPTLVL